MNEQPLMTERWEEKAQHLAHDFRYPPTPDIASGVRRRARRFTRRVWRAVAIAALLMLLAILVIPPVRAFVLEIVRVGVVRIFLVEPTSSPTPRAALFDLPGRTTLAEAQAITGSPIPLPTYPLDLDEPDLVFVHQYDGPVITLVWLEPGSADQVWLVLEMLNLRVVASKLYPYEGERQSTQVRDYPAEWLTESHEVHYFSRDIEVRRPVTGHVLIWQAASVTYRLETDLPLEEALKIAESLPPEN
jgi:hypothetical protein